MGRDAVSRNGESTPAAAEYAAGEFPEPPDGGRGTTVLLEHLPGGVDPLSRHTGVRYGHAGTPTYSSRGFGVDSTRFTYSLPPLFAGRRGEVVNVVEVERRSERE